MVTYQALLNNLLLRLFQNLSLWLLQTYLPFLLNDRSAQQWLPHLDLIYEFYKKHICRLPEWPDPLLRAFKHLNEEVYVMMQGPSEFKVGGRLLSWDRWNDMKNITVPTLTIGAKYDTMNPEEMEEMSKMVKRGRYLYCTNGSHCDFWDDQQTYFNGLIKFIKDVDAGK